MAYKYTVAQWIEECDNGNLIDYDGFGYLGTETEESKIKIFPSQRILVSVYLEYTHVWWYNK